MMNIMEAAIKLPTIGDQRVELHEVPQSKFGVWLIETYRKCLNCGRGFWSWGSDNRICQRCKDDPIYQAIGELVAEGNAPLYDEEIVFEGREGPSPPSHWDALRERGEEIVCPRCGKTVYRPGTASTHPCFIWSQEDVDMKLNSFIGAQGDNRTVDHGHCNKRNSEGKRLCQAFAYVEDLDEE